MPKRNSKFTDSNLKLFYGNLLNHYKECTKKIGTSDPNAVYIVYKELFLATQHAVDSPQGSLNHLERREKEKIYTAFHTIFYALPLFTRLSPDKQRNFNPSRPPHHYLINTPPQYTYNCSEPNLFNWVTLNKNLNPYEPYFNKNTAQEGLKINTKKSSGLLAGLAIMTLVFSAVVLTIASWYYLLYQFLNSAERLWYNEGWLRAVLMSAAALTSSSITTTCTLIFAASPIITVALAANLNPVTMLIVTGICLASIGASLGVLLTNTIHDFIENRTHKKTIDSSDPYRFRLTDDEEDELIEKHIDPIKVRCALVALRVEINSVLDNEEQVPSFLNRHFGNSKYKQVQPLLQMVRALRRGDITEAVFGDLKFDCRAYESHLPQFNLLSSTTNVYPKLFTHGSVESHLNNPPLPPVLSMELTAL